jgi:hypothetical protein
MKFNATYYWFGIFALCFLAYQQIQDTIRPNYTGGSSVITYLLGVAPNFFPAIGIPALLVLIIPYAFKRNNSDTWIIEKRHLFANLIALIGLIGWEFIQLSGKLRFDWNDILWTLIGALIFQLIWVLSPERFKKLD